MTNSAIRDIVGKRIHGVIVKECRTPPRMTLTFHLLFGFGERPVSVFFTSIRLVEGLAPSKLPDMPGTQGRAAL